MNKIINKKAVLVAAAAMAVCIAGSASADEPPPGANQKHTPQLPTPISGRLDGRNNTSGCVRFYVNGQHDVRPGSIVKLGTVTNNQSFRASVFKRACGGAALKTVKFTASGVKPNFTLTWVVK